ncbi:hypothetical protein DBIPINDM_007520 (plasmid) [Mesorhizobium sp. AR02]|uniref:hypothetical protein n=1 Tax=Mesorhizobium sp. AR02 TaxID=2865837 RepID=UPI00215E320C|nr:hypothetical protein [Mesorhizobium sp. AR02]UVK50213.1 hypothetical protein DBIPINDM_007520 [Mesorhizobium sp. AR02]
MIAAVAMGLFAGAAQADGDAAVSPEIWTAEIPEPLVGPYISDPATLMALDRPGDGKSCEHAGPLNFQCLVYRDDRSTMSPVDFANNPFSISVFEEVRRFVKKDLEAQTADHLSTKFLSFAGAKIELVGVVNRMDRQFNRDKVPERGKALACGEISAIYRFAYKGSLDNGPANDRSYQSRLPVTLNVVFPAEPWSGSPGCRTVAARWRDYVRALKAGAKPNDQLNQAKLLVSTLLPSDVDRIELNMQGSRVSASDDESDFGTRATYIIRVFRWKDASGSAKGHWGVSYLTNQIDRARLLGNSQGDENTCPDRKGNAISRKALANYLLSMDDPKKVRNAKNGFADVDLGLVNIPIEFLACRAVSISPGGASRSANQPFWNDPKNPILSDADIKTALTKYSALYPNSLNFVGNPEEFRTRLNEASCSGCHQSRAIAGFHFPGSDRPGTATVNAIFLPGSAHFFGDQPRRVEIVEALAALPADQEVQLPRRLLATSYAVRPQNSYRALRPTSAAKIQLVAGWGGACLITKKADDRRDWGCEGDLSCQTVFASANQRGIGMCLGPRNPPRIGEAMQFGKVTTTSYGSDKYVREMPLNSDRDDTRISVAALPRLATNTYIASHQEYYPGDDALDPIGAETLEQHARRILEQKTGGFPGGSLRLGQCKDLPGEATCGLLASSGFTACLGEVAGAKRTAESCFRVYTSYSGVRGCDPADPCRDDYICMSPMGYTPANAKILFDRRAEARKNEQMSYPVGSDRLKIFNLKFFGEDIPDDKWLKRTDRRGVCIPPYFVFQFKADGHVVPPNP